MKNPVQKISNRSLVDSLCLGDLDILDYKIREASEMLKKLQRSTWSTTGANIWSFFTFAVLAIAGFYG